MPKKRERSKAFSLLEVMVAAVVFTLFVAGVFSSIKALNNPLTTTDKQSKGVQYGKRFLESLSKEVRADTWDIAGSNNLTIGTRAIPADPDFPGFSGNYTVSSQSGARKVILTIATP